MNIRVAGRIVVHCSLDVIWYYSVKMGEHQGLLKLFYFFFQLYSRENVHHMVEAKDIYRLNM